MSMALEIYAWIILVVGIYCLFLSSGNVRFLKRTKPKVDRCKGPKVSVLVPARNEEENIGPLLDSLLDQDYEDYEILVLDDNSTDGTWAILQRYQEEHPDKLRIFHGKPKTNSVINGKTFALSQIEAEAKGTYILATDADTRHVRSSISQGVTMLEDLGLDMLSGFPEERCPTYWGSVIISAMNFATVFYVPMAFSYRHPNEYFTLANGQYICMRREVLESLGGYNAIDRLTCDDVRLAKHFIKNGRRYAMVHVSDLVSCDMYKDTKSAFAGISRSVGGIFPSTKASVVPIFFVALILLGLAVSPVISLLMLIDINSHALPLMVNIIGFALMMYSWYMAARMQRFSKAVSLSYGPALVLTCAMYFYSYAINIQGKPFIWKDREIVTENARKDRKADNRS